MARFTADNVDKYGGQGGAGFFQLKNDKDVALVRFLYDSADDVEGYAVHEVEIDGKKRYVNCIREYNQPIDDCPFCRERKPQFAKLWIPLFNEDEGKVQVWERGKKFFSKISGICARTKGSIVQHTFEIERNGKAGDQQTTYEIYPTSDVDDVTLDDYEMPQILGGLVLDKTAEDMEYFLEEGAFPPDEEEEETPRRRSSRREEAPRRASSRREEPEDEEEEEPEERPVRKSSRPSGRRTPARGGEGF